MLNRIRTSAVFRYGLMAAATLLFLLFKYRDISLPYFWDEMAGYMSGILYMTDHGISLHPAAVPPQMSYGHPLLMHSVMATVAVIFGPSVEAMHITTLVFTLLLALVVYLLAAHFSDDQFIPFASFLLFLWQPVVLAQSTQVLLEMFLALHTMAALYFYLKKKFVLSVLFCMAGVMTKETGLVLAIAFPVHLILSALTGNEEAKFAFRKVLLYFLPFIAFGLFLVWQKQAHGWYLNPVNVGKSKLDLVSMLQKIWDYPLEFTFINQGRFVPTIILAAAAVLYMVKGEKKTGMGNMDTVLLIVFSFGFMLFSSVADTLERYFLMLIPLAVVLFAHGIRYTENLSKNLPPLLLLICLGAGLLFSDNGKRYSEADLSYRHLVKTNVALMDYLNSGSFENDTVAFAFPLQYAPTDARYGYFKKRRFVPDTASRPSTRYLVFSSPGNADWNPPDTQRLKLVRGFSSAWSHAWLYEKR